MGLVAWLAILYAATAVALAVFLIRTPRERLPGAGALAVVVPVGFLFGPAFIIIGMILLLASWPWWMLPGRNTGDGPA